MPAIVLYTYTYPIVSHWLFRHNKQSENNGPLPFSKNSIFGNKHIGWQHLCSTFMLNVAYRGSNSLVTSNLQPHIIQQNHSQNAKKRRWPLDYQFTILICYWRGLSIQADIQTRLISTDTAKGDFIYVRWAEDAEYFCICDMQASVIGMQVHDVSPVHIPSCLPRSPLRFLKR